MTTSEIFPQFPDGSRLAVFFDMQPGTFGKFAAVRSLTYAWEDIPPETLSDFQKQVIIFHCAAAALELQYGEIQQLEVVEPVSIVSADAG
jgi:hypothetical protein